MYRRSLALAVALVMLGTVLPSTAAADAASASDDTAVSTPEMVQGCLFPLLECLEEIWNEYTCWGLECEPHFPLSSSPDLVQSCASIAQLNDCLEEIWNEYTCWDFECNPQYPL